METLTNFLSNGANSLFARDKKGDRGVAINLAIEPRRSLRLSPAPCHPTPVRDIGQLYVPSRNQPLIRVANQEPLRPLDQIELGAGESHQAVISNE